MAYKKKLNFNIKFFKVEKLLRDKKFHVLIQVLLVAGIVLNLLGLVYQQRAKYFYQDYWKNFPALEKVFLSSQYVNKHPKGWIPDETAFSYASGKLIIGTNPVLVLPDAPPLGKYIIGLSTIVFNNDSVVILVSAILSLFLLYILGLQIFSTRSFALIPPFFLSFEPIFKNQLIYTPLLDILQLVFLLSLFYCFNKGLKTKRSLLFFFLANLFLGFFISTKFFVSGFTIIAAWFLVLLLKKDKKRLINITLTLPISLFVLLFSYVRVFAFGYSINKFLGIQKWVYLYHQSFLILPFSVWPLLLFDKWYVWFGNKAIITDGQWSLTWPILSLITIISIILYVFKKIPKNESLEVLISWVIVYMAFLSLGETFSRYFVILIPILYIISVYGILSIFKNYKK